MNANPMDLTVSELVARADAGQRIARETELKARAWDMLMSSQHPRCDDAVMDAWQWLRAATAAPCDRCGWVDHAYDCPVLTGKPSNRCECAIGGYEPSYPENAGWTAHAADCPVRTSRRHGFEE